MDIGYAFLPEYSGKGYAYEATLTGLEFAKNQLHYETIYAIVQGNNDSSIKLLNKINFISEGKVEIDGEVLLKFRNRS